MLLPLYLACTVIRQGNVRNVLNFKGRSEFFAAYMTLCIEISKESTKKSELINKFSKAAGY